MKTASYRSASAFSPAARTAAGLKAVKSIFERLMQMLHPFMPFLTEEIWQDIAERKANADAEISKMLNDAAVKSEGIVTAAHDSVARQQALFDKLKKAVSLEEKKADIATKKTRVIMETVKFIDYPPLLLPQKFLLPYFWILL